VRLARNGLALADQVGLTAAGIAKGFNLPDPSEHFSTIIAVLGFAFMARVISQEEMG